MIPSQTLESFPVFSDTGTKVKPGDAKYSAGFQQSDVLPAEWVNWEWNKASKGITDLNTGMTSVEAEINSVLAGANKSPDATKTNQLLESIAKLIDDAETRAKLAAHPVGSLYWSSDSTDPGTLFGGTWARIKDTFVWAAGDSDTVNNTGGSKTHTIDANELPVHSHALGGSTGKTQPSFSGSQVDSGAMSGNSTGYVTKALFESGPSRSGNITLTSAATWTRGYSGSTSSWSEYTLNVGVAHTHKVTAAGTVENHDHTLPANTGNNTTTATAMSIMPPYTIKYCWERTA